ncbi:hypothetical protein BH23GEM6_BH23GEM6_26710 [soil metagenome]
MFRQQRSYDYGLRGEPQRPPMRRSARPGVRYGENYERRADPLARQSNRVTAPYTYDYVYGGRGAHNPRNFNAYTGDHPERMQDSSGYHRPYMTNAGTRTWRGAMPPQRYDYPDFGPDYGGRYPDEL